MEEVYIMVSLLAGAGAFAADRIFKKKVEEGSIAEGTTFLKDLVTVKKSHNSGFVMNKADDKPKFVLITSSLILGMVVANYLSTLGKKRQGLKRFGLGMVIGGAASNLTDRAKNDEVTDYLTVTGKDKCVFNIADAAICLGSALAAIGEMFTKEKDDQE